ncbi:hypothetical protein SAMN05444673_6168 [Bacillus sp. OV166]|uniref:putative holin-like toxin n=1 Tax=Bacillus sp. OV166 TaxID=1882763 RepID=UPI000A2AE2A8|nr:putative holin-like toxin [Bacillus sp. OV166]SMQ84907.1 hypothetical protein SAMN05444673_6168 [Bacillus sp. OV166]
MATFEVLSLILSFGMFVIAVLKFQIKIRFLGHAVKACCLRLFLVKVYVHWKAMGLHIPYNAVVPFPYYPSFMSSTYQIKEVDP